MTADERKRALESIAEHSDQLNELGRRFDHLRWMAENDASDAFVELANAAGKMTTASLSQLATLLELMFTAQTKVGARK